MSSGNEVANPSVSATTSVRAAADAHLARYGAAFGLERPGTSLTYAGRSATASRQDVVRYDQTVGGVPVIGGEVVVSVRRDRQLGSVLATVSDATVVPSATVSEADAAETARATVAGATGLPAGSLPVADDGRWLWDPAVLGTDSPVGARGVWRFDVGDGESALHTVLVDDRSGSVLLDIDDLQSALDRVVCDRNNVRGAETSCTSSFARTEGAPATGIPDVDNAYLHAGEVWTFYDDVADVDLTTLLGVNVGGQPKLAATVRFCRTTGSCPYANAFWNGTQMFYGAGLRRRRRRRRPRDDPRRHRAQRRPLLLGPVRRDQRVAGRHHGRDRRPPGHPRSGRTTSWPLGEDLPGGALRNLSNPPRSASPTG